MKNKKLEDVLVKLFLLSILGAVLVLGVYASSIPTDFKIVKATYSIEYDCVNGYVKMTVLAPVRAKINNVTLYADIPYNGIIRSGKIVIVPGRATIIKALDGTYIFTLSKDILRTGRNTVIIRINGTLGISPSGWLRIYSVIMSIQPDVKSLFNPYNTVISANVDET